MSIRPIIEVRGLGKHYQLGTAASGGWLKRLLDRGQPPAANSPLGHIWALRDVSFKVDPGERIGILGRNGAGKSTLLKILSRVVYPTEGEARLRGRVTSLLEVGTGFNDNLTGRENIYLNAAFHGLGRDEIGQRMDEIVSFAETGTFIDTPVKFYSSGMRARLAFSIAAHLDPDILMLDEVLSVGDMGFQQKCLARMQTLTGGDRTLLFVSHSIDAVHRFCDRAIWLDGGRIQADGAVDEVARAYVEATLAVRPKHQATQLSDSDTGDESQPSGVPPRAEALSPVLERNAVLLDAEIIDHQGKSSSVVAVETPIGVSFRFETSASGIYVPAIGLYCPKGTLVFWSVPSWTDNKRYRLAAGIHRAEVRLLGHLLNIGVYTLTIAVIDPSFAPMKRYFTAERALSFQTVSTPGQALRARGILPRDFPGPLCPRLDWSLAEAAQTETADCNRMAQ